MIGLTLEYSVCSTCSHRRTRSRTTSHGLDGYFATQFAEAGAASALQSAVNDYKACSDFEVVRAHNQSPPNTNILRALLDIFKGALVRCALAWICAGPARASVRTVLRARVPGRYRLDGQSSWRRRAPASRSAGATRISRSPPSPPKPSNAESASSVGRSPHLIPFATEQPAENLRLGLAGQTYRDANGAPPCREANGST